MCFSPPSASSSLQKTGGTAMEHLYSRSSSRPPKKERGLVSRVPRLLARIGTAAVLLLPIASALRQHEKNSLVAAPAGEATPAGNVTGKTAVCPAAVPEHPSPASATEYTATLSE
ncbi:hypothetical protein CSUI_010319, partial [Cystoisospora suis]